MGSKIGAGVAGLVGWVILATVLNVPLRTMFDGYAEAERTMTFTLGMQITRLVVGALASIGAGWVAARLAPRGSRVPLIAGTIVLIAMVPVHIQLWSKFPIWYHVFFLATIVPFFWLGARGVGTSNRSRSANGA